MAPEEVVVAQVIAAVWDVHLTGEGVPVFRVEVHSMPEGHHLAEEVRISIRLTEAGGHMFPPGFLFMVEDGQGHPI